MKYRFFILSLSAILLVNCSDDYEASYYLDDSIFIPDPEIPGLPIYSEQGCNTFGVRLDRENILYDPGNYPLKVIVKNDTSSFIFDGHSSYSDYKITFLIDDLSPTEESGLMELDQVAYDLESDNISIEIQDCGETIQPEIISGGLNFKRVQNLYVDDVYKGVILSGIFNFKVIIDGTPFAFSDGRFDVIVGYSNFYVL